MKKRKRRKPNYIKLFFLSFLTVLLSGGICVAILYYHMPPEMEVFYAVTGCGEVMAVSGEECLEVSEGAKACAEAQKEAAQQEVTGENGSEEIKEDHYDEKIFYRKSKVLGEVELVFGGDICFFDDFALMVSYRARNGEIEKCLSAELLDEVRGADVFLLNNEFVYSDRGIPIPEKAFTFRSKPENVKILTDMGVDLVGLANNHIYDYGEEALLDTFDVLKGANVPYMGAGRNLEEARKPVYFVFDDLTVAYVNATQIERNETPDTKGATENTAGAFRCFNAEEFSVLLETIKEAKQKADFVIVYIHWGTENTDEIDWAQLTQGPQIAEAGADLIVGNHTHCLQGIAPVYGVPTIYSVGNFWFNSKELDTCILKVKVTKDGMKSFQFLPAKQQNCTTALLSGNEKERVLAYMRSISPEVTIDNEGFVDFSKKP